MVKYRALLIDKIDLDIHGVLVLLYFRVMKFQISHRFSLALVHRVSPSHNPVFFPPLARSSHNPFLCRYVQQHAPEIALGVLV
jgi:hypothetical protein